jgi:hypothetical protein
MKKHQTRTQEEGNAEQKILENFAVYLFCQLPKIRANFAKILLLPSLKNRHFV